MNGLFLALEFAVVSISLLTAYSLRSRMGLGPVVAVVASLQFTQALLSTSLYWPFGPDMVLTPGSCVLFAANLAIVVYAFARDGTIPARTILYGIMIANGVNFLVNLTIAAHIQYVEPVRLLDIPNELFDRGLVASLVGIALLYVDQILAILAFAWLRQHLSWMPTWLAMALVLAGVLAFDTVGYLVPLFWGSPKLGNMLVSGLIAKGLGGLAFGLVWGAIASREGTRANEGLSGILNVLVFREDLTTLRRAAITDEMTNLYNRRSYRLVIERVVEASRVSGEEFSLLVVDADHFKQVNDRLGHSCGDRVIVAIAGALRGATRSDDFCFRLGGDEFALVLPSCNRLGAREVAARLSEFRFEDERLDHPVTLTVGAVTFPSDGETPEQLFEIADRRLYAGKELGRGRRVVSEAHESA